MIGTALHNIESKHSSLADETGALTGRSTLSCPSYKVDVKRPSESNKHYTLNVQQDNAQKDDFLHLKQERLINLLSAENAKLLRIRDVTSKLNIYYKQKTIQMLKQMGMENLCENIPTDFMGLLTSAVRGFVSSSAQKIKQLQVKLQLLQAQTASPQVQFIQKVVSTPIIPVFIESEERKLVAGQKITEELKIQICKGIVDTSSEKLNNGQVLHNFKKYPASLIQETDSTQEVIYVNKTYGPTVTLADSLQKAAQQFSGKTQSTETTVYLESLARNGKTVLQPCDKGTNRNDGF